MVVVEAMAAGIPALLSTDVGIAQEVDEAGAGKMVIPEPNEVATVWNKILTDDKLRNLMKKKGMELVAECFEIDIVANKMLELFHTVTDKGK
jgi:glycosyltransferase involved in cell wall biosynthesis